MLKRVVAVFFLFACALVSAQQALNNDAVLKLVKTGLSDDVILATINASQGTYDTSPAGLKALKDGGVSDRVVLAIEQKATLTSQPAAQSAPPAVSAVAASTPENALKPPQPRIFIKAGQKDFGVAIAAAFQKKDVPASIVLDSADADYVLDAADVAAKQESTGSKFTRCLFADCIGIEGTSSVSVQLIKESDGSVVWAYQVRKANGGPAGIQSLSEAIAKHLKNDYLNHHNK